MQIYSLGAAKDRPFYSGCFGVRSNRMAHGSLRGRGKPQSIEADTLAARVASLAATSGELLTLRRRSFSYHKRSLEKAGRIPSFRIGTCVRSHNGCDETKSAVVFLAELFGLVQISVDECNRDFSTTTRRCARMPNKSVLPLGVRNASSRCSSCALHTTFRRCRMFPQGATAQRSIASRISSRAPQ
jgi:hypothetical protein